MKFDVGAAVNNGRIVENTDPQLAPLPQSDFTAPVKETPVQRQARLNQQQTGRIVEREDPASHQLKTSSDRDVMEAVQELPNTLADMRNFGDRLTMAKLRLGLGEGGFPNQNIETFNFKTRTPEPPVYMPSQRINAELVMREPSMSDDELDEFFMKYYVEYDVNGNPLPKKYPHGKLSRPPQYVAPLPTQPQYSAPPPRPSLEQSLDQYQQTLPYEPLPTGHQPVPASQLLAQDPGFPNQPAALPPPPEEMTSEQIAADIKVKFKLEERPIGVVRKKLDPNKLTKLTEMELDRNSVPCTAVASRYKCDITPLSYREFDQIRAMVETSKLAREMKLWSLIYRHVKNPTIGQFKSFNEFCEKTAWIDRRRFWFAMMCGMTKDEETIEFTCINPVFKPIDVDITGIPTKYDLSGFQEKKQDAKGVSFLPTNILEVEDMNVYVIIDNGSQSYKYIPILTDPDAGIVTWVAAEQKLNCGTLYNHEYINRSLIDTDVGEKWVLAEIEKVNAIGSMSEALEYFNEGPLVSKRIMRINDNISLEIGVKSVADMLRNDYKYLLDEELPLTIMKEARKDIKEMRGQAYEPTDEEVQQYLQDDVPDSTIIPILGMAIIHKAIGVIDGEECETDIDDEIVSILKNNCSPIDIIPLFNTDVGNNLLYRYLTSYEPTFSYKGCQCPACHEVSNVPIDKIEDLVFTLSRSLMTIAFDIGDL